MSISAELMDILSKGSNKFGLNIGIISNIVDDNYRVFVCNDKSSNIKPGDEFELTHSYCSDVVKEGKTKYYEDVADISEMLKHPCYLNTQLRAYIGTPLIVNGEIWGTLNYSSLLPSAVDYSQEQIDYLEYQAKSVSKILENQQALML